MNFSDHYNYYAANDTPASDESDNSSRFRDLPVIPLPEQEENSSVNSGTAMPDADMPAISPIGTETERQIQPDINMPVIPLPNPGEGGPVNGGSIKPDYTPVIPLPTPGNGGPINGGINPDYTPVIPLPTPGNSAPIAPGFPNSIITVLPRPILPCFFCNTNTFGNVRFLNAATGYNPFRIAINNQTVVNNLEYAEISDYGRVSSGYQTVTVSGQNGYIYISKQIQINTGTKTTIAIVNTASGLDLVPIADTACNTPPNFSCLRACNLSYNSGPLNLLLSNGYSIFRNIQFMEVTSFSRLLPGNYQFFVARNGRVLVSSDIDVRSNSIYTVFMFNWNNSPDAIRTMVVEDRK